MRLILLLLIIVTLVIESKAQDYQTIELDSEITMVQPMTGIVFWPGNSRIETDAISLEFSYMLYNDIVSEKGVYDWTPVEELLDEMASRNHQAVLRFRFSYPGRETSVPDYIKALDDYHETEGESEGRETWFPDWTHPELKRFTLEFYEKYAEKYDNDKRLAFVQTGFGLWAEYHIYDGPFVLGETFPSKDFQAGFFQHLDTIFTNTHWSISIDAASDTYSPFQAQPELKEIGFGLFDDSFMHRNHSGYNTSNWNFFDRERYKWAPAGGEFSYYTDYDQQNVLNEHVGAHGIAFETFVENFHMSYINGNDQPRYQSMDRIKEASMYMGYRFKINSFQSMDGSSIVNIENVGVAPIYYDAYVAVNGVRAVESLIYLSPGETLTCEIPAGSAAPVLTIESDRILDSQTIQYYGTINEPYSYIPQDVEEKVLSIGKNQEVKIIYKSNNFSVRSKNTSLQYVSLHNLSGQRLLIRDSLPEQTTRVDIPAQWPAGIYIIKTNLGTTKVRIK
ncbi:hypothetical protein [Marinoscillum sp.]|uniref:hypothetical protein n=1 Tax=Marinoscillum sp. TaxID=2024838 RepID=UPI003BAACDC5